MTRTRYTMPARSQGKLYMQRGTASLERDDVETLVRKWLVQRLDGFYCDLQVMYTPPLHTMARTDEAVEVDARDLNALDTVKAIIKATGLNPHMSVCGWPCAGGRLGWRRRHGGRCCVA